MPTSVMESPPGPETVIDGERYVYFGGTSYLGLHGHPDVIEAGCRAFRQFGMHTATSRAGFGNSPPVIEVENLAARFFGTEEAFWFSSGYAANHVIVPALATEATEIFLDDAAHYCVEEAARLAGRPVVRFRHRDPDDLAAVLRSRLSAGGRPLVMADGVVPPTGRVAPVAAYLRVLGDFAPARLHLDDAHGFGVLGANGRGTFDDAGLWTHVNGGPPIDGVDLSVCGTLAKALGGFGGVVPGTRAFLRRVRAASHYFDGASAPPAPVAGGTAAALAICLARPELRADVRVRAGSVRVGLRALGVAVPDDPTPVIGFGAGSGESMRQLHARLKDEGILVPYVAAYSGLGAEGIMRLAVCAGHSHAMVERLLAAVRTNLT